MRRVTHLLVVVSLWGLLALPLSGQTMASQTHASVAGQMLSFGATTLVADGKLFVGRPGESALFPMPGSEPGSVHVFRRDGSAWTQSAMIAAEDGKVGNGFGRALAAAGDVLAVGAPTQDSAGVVYVFRRSGSKWTQIDRLAPEELVAGDGFGSALAFQGDNLLVGAPNRSGVGSVFAYHREAGAFTVEELAGDGGTEDARFGAAVAVEGDLAVVGAPGPFGLGLISGPPAFQPGTAYVYDRSGGAWERSSELSPASGGSFGVTVQIVDGQVLVGAPIADQAAGAVFRYAPDATGQWAMKGKLGPSSPQGQELFGYAMAVAGDHLLVGSPGSAGLSGAVHVLDATGEGDWVESQVLSEKTRGLLGFYGSAVSGDADVIVVGAPASEFFEGIGFVYTREGDRWSTANRIVESAAGLAAVTGGEQRCSEDGHVGDFTCADVELVSFLPVSAVGGERGIMVSDLWGWTDPETRREYAILGRFDGTSFVDVTDAENPVYLGNLPLTPGATENLWRDVKVYANYAFIVADNAGQHGVQIFDLTRLRDVSSPPVEFDEDANYDGIASAHNIVINEETGFAYTVGNSGGGNTCGGALHMIDIHDPLNPTFAGCYNDPSTGKNSPGYTHDAQCVSYRGPDTDYTGHEICFNSSETALGIADVTDKDNPTPISSATYPNVAYAHQGWVSEDQKYFFMDDEEDELMGLVKGTRTLVWDIEDLDDPVLATEYISDDRASDHNLYIRGNFMYQSNYVSGLRIFDISDPTHPKPVGFFDTVPWSEDAPGFAGSWSNYPFFESGNILVSSMREGLFILRRRQTELVP